MIYLEIPKFCPYCNTKLIIKQENESEILFCPNENCNCRLVNKLDHFCSKSGLDIKGLSKAGIEKLMDWGWLNSIKDIFELESHYMEWTKKSGFGPASVNKILNGIKDARVTTLDKVIAAAGIPEIGTRVAKDLAKHFDNWEDFRNTDSYLFIDGIGEVMNDNLLKFDYTDIDYVAKNQLEIEEKELNPVTASLEDKVFCITGKTHIFKNRAELQADIENKGGKVVSSMSSKVTHLINNDNTSTSSKNLAAQRAGIPIITEEEYLQMNN